LANFAVDIVSSDPGITPGLAIVAVDIPWSLQLGNDCSYPLPRAEAILLQRAPECQPINVSDIPINVMAHGDAFPLPPAPEAVTVFLIQDGGAISMGRGDIQTLMPVPEVRQSGVLPSNAGDVQANTNAVPLQILLGS
jgi:hypothetical protein